MTQPTKELLRALVETIEHLESDGAYQWGHMGQCNCGHLVHALTDIPRSEIHAAALQRAGDWGQQAIDYCPTSGYPLDHIITTMLSVGLRLEDIDHLEQLSDPNVLARLPLADRWLKRNRKEDAVLYMKTWLDLLNEQTQNQPISIASKPQNPSSHDKRQVA